MAWHYNWDILTINVIILWVDIKVSVDSSFDNEELFPHCFTSQVHYLSRLI